MWFLILASIVLLVMLISFFKVQPFISFLIAALILGLLSGFKTDIIIDAIQRGIGSTLASIVSIIVLGSMIGKIISKSNANIVITDALVKFLGPKQLLFAFMIIGFIISLPLFFSVAFLLMTPLVLSTAKRQHINPVYLGIPMLASLSITQGFLPPHPAPYYLVTHLPGADLGVTLGLGILIAIPAMLISGWLFGMTLKNIQASPINFTPDESQRVNPGLISSLLVLSLPVLLIALHSFFNNNVVAFIGQPIVALLIALLAAIYLLGLKQQVAWSDIQDWLLDSIKDVAPLILTFAGAGAFKEILQIMQVGEEVLKLTQSSLFNPLIIGWLMAALLRVVTGSSTVAGITTAGLILPVLSHSEVNPNLLALSIGAGSMVMSHVNDAGFWLYKEYFGVSIEDTLRSWTIMETILGVVGLMGVLVLQKFM